MTYTLEQLRKSFENCVEYFDECMESLKNDILEKRDAEYHGEWVCFDRPGICPDYDYQVEEYFGVPDGEISSFESDCASLIYEIKKIEESSLDEKFDIIIKVIKNDRDFCQRDIDEYDYSDLLYEYFEEEIKAIDAFLNEYC